MEISERAVGSPCVSFLIVSDARGQRASRVPRRSSVVGRTDAGEQRAGSEGRGTRDEGRRTRARRTCQDMTSFFSVTYSLSFTRRVSSPVDSTEDTTIRAARAELNAHRERGRGRFFERVESATGDPPQRISRRRDEST